MPGFDGDPAWSPNGRQIVFESTRSGNSDIWVMNADGTNPRQPDPQEPAFDGDPAWSPGGSRIAFTSTRNGNREIYLMNPDGSGLLNITNNPADDFDPTLGAGRAVVAFVSNRDRNLEIYETNDRFLLKRLTHDLRARRLPRLVARRQVDRVHDRPGRRRQPRSALHGQQRRRPRRHRADAGARLGPGSGLAEKPALARRRCAPPARAAAEHSPQTASPTDSSRPSPASATPGSYALRAAVPSSPSASARAGVPRSAGRHVAGVDPDLPVGARR